MSPHQEVNSIICTQNTHIRYLSLTRQFSNPQLGSSYEHRSYLFNYYKNTSKFQFNMFQMAVLKLMLHSIYNSLSVSLEC